MLAWILAAVVALAAPDDDLAALDAGLARLRALDLTGPPESMSAALKQGVAEVKDLQDRAVASAREAPPEHRAQVSVRLGEAYLALVDALVAAPCPAQLGPEQCAFYAGAIAEKAQVMLHPAEDALSRARGLAAHLDRKEGKRLAHAEASLVRTSAQVTAALPPPRVRQAPAPPAVAPEPHELGGPGPLPPGWRPVPARVGYDQVPQPDPAVDWVQVDKTAWLSAGRDGSGPRARSLRSPPADGAPEPMIARLLTVDGDRALLEVGPGDERVHCLADTPWSDRWRLRLWVDRAALLPVTTAPIQQTFADGTAIDLRPGALITAQGLWVDGVLLPTTPAPSVVGDRYRALPPPAPRGDAAAWIDDGTQLSLDGRPLPRPPQAWFGDPRRPVQAVLAATDGERVRLDSVCGSVTLGAQGRDPDVRGLGGIVGGLMGNMSQDAEQTRIQAGTPLVWPDGAPAGVLLTAHLLPTAELTPRADGRQCFDLELDWLDAGPADFPDRHLNVCVAGARAPGAGL